jgi:gluconate 5-dehydrogenase
MSRKAIELFDLTGRLALITGSSRGLGAAIARALAEAGATIVLNGRDERALAVTAAAFERDGLRATTAPFDVTDPAAVAAAIEHIEERQGPIAILVNNAGIQIRQPLVEFTAEDWRRIFATNVDSAFYVAQAVAKHMIGRGHGKIINIGSVQSELGRPSIAPYAATKGAIRMLTRAMATEWGPLGLQINAIAPGYFDTDLTAALVEDETFSGWLFKRVPAGRWGRPDELGGAAIFLASDASSFVNGHLLMVDGGMTASV